MGREDAGRGGGRGMGGEEGAWGVYPPRRRQVGGLAKKSRRPVGWGVAAGSSNVGEWVGPVRGRRRWQQWG